MKGGLAIAAMALGLVNGISAADSCTSSTPIKDLCPACDNKNITDAGSKWAVSCDYLSLATKEAVVQGEVSVEGCLDACDDNDTCYGVNLLAGDGWAAGNCTVLLGTQKSLDASMDVINLYRLNDTATSTSQGNAKDSKDAKITSTVFAGGLTAPFSSAISTTASAPSASPSCDLELDHLCPSCNGVEVSLGHGKYTILCDFELDSSNGTYYPQKALSPAGCIDQCDELPFCKGASYYDYKDCEVAKGEFTSASKSGYTAFIPVASTAAPAASSVPTSSKVSITATTVDPAVSILPTNSGCDVDAITCPACNGVPVPDKLNSSYTVVCSAEAICDSEPVRNDTSSQEVCLEYCDQDATCLAVKWYSQTKSCHLCQQGLDQGANSDNLPYVVLVADADGNDELLTSRSITTSTKSAPATTITDLPSPFPTTTTSTSVKTSSSTSTKEAARPASINPGGPIKNITTTASAITSSVTTVGAVTCPGYSNDVYIEPETGNYYEVVCDSNYSGAAHSQYISASDFAACVASCTGDCDGVQFGYSTRCGLYTDISVIADATGWTVGVSITVPTPITTTTSAKATTLTSVTATTTAASSPPKYGNGTRS